MSIFSPTAYRVGFVFLTRPPKPEVGIALDAEQRHDGVRCRSLRHAVDRLGVERHDPLQFLRRPRVNRDDTVLGARWRRLHDDGHDVWPLVAIEVQRQPRRPVAELLESDCEYSRRSVAGTSSRTPGSVLSAWTESPAEARRLLNGHEKKAKKETRLTSRRLCANPYGSPIATALQPSPLPSPKSTGRVRMETRSRRTAEISASGCGRTTIRRHAASKADTSTRADTPDRRAGGHPSSRARPASVLSRRHRSTGMPSAPTLHRRAAPTESPLPSVRSVLLVALRCTAGRATACCDLRWSVGAACRASAPPCDRRSGNLRGAAWRAERLDHRHREGGAEDVAVFDRRPRDAAQRPRAVSALLRQDARDQPASVLRSGSLSAAARAPKARRARRPGNRRRRAVRRVRGRKESRPRQLPAIGRGLFVDAQCPCRARPIPAMSVMLW